MHLSLTRCYVPATDDGLQCDTCFFSAPPSKPLNAFTARDVTRRGLQRTFDVLQATCVFSNIKNDRQRLS